MDSQVLAFLVKLGANIEAHEIDRPDWFRLTATDGIGHRLSDLLKFLPGDAVIGYNDNCGLDSNPSTLDITVTPSGVESIEASVRNFIKRQES